MTTTVDYTKAITQALAYAKSKGMTIRQVAIKAGVTENTVNYAKKGRDLKLSNWAAIIMACGYVEIHCVLRTKEDCNNG